MEDIKFMFSRELHHPKIWDELYTVLEHAKNNQVELCINKWDKVYITIEKLERGGIGGCGQCKRQYEYFWMKGKLRADYIQDKYHKRLVVPYETDVSQWYMHSCLYDESWESGEFLALLKIDTKGYYPQYLLDANFVTTQLAKN